MVSRLLQRLVGVLSIWMLAFGSLMVFAPAAKVSAQRDCDANAVIYCGVSGLSELVTKYRQNQGGNVHAIFAHFGIPNESYFDQMTVGRVTKNGEVYAGSELVATGAMTAGRQNMPGSTKIPGIEAYKRPPSVSFRSESLPALVKMVDGRFHSAVIMSCGNPVSANPVQKPKPQPKPQPKPRPKPQPKPKPKNPAMEIEKEVRLSGNSTDTDDENDDTNNDRNGDNGNRNNRSDRENNADSGGWRQQVTADPGNTVEYRITVTNTGDTPLTEVEIQDSLPTDISFDNANLRGSTGVHDFTTSELVGDGITIDTLGVDESVEIIFSVTVGNDADACDIPMRNIAYAQAKEVPEIDDDALIKVCQPEQPPVVKAVQTPPPARRLPDTGMAGAFVIFSITSVLGAAVYKLKELYALFLR